MKRRAWGAALVLVVFSLAVGLMVAVFSAGPTSTAPPTGASADRAEPSESAGGARPAAIAPVSDVDEASLNVPGDARFGSETVFLEAEKSYVVDFSLKTTKPEDAPGVALYLAVSFRCEDAAGKSLASIGGTQNLLPGGPVDLRNQVLLRPRTAGAVACSVYVNSPYDDIAAVGTELALRSEWRLWDAGAHAVQAQTAARLPALLPAAEKTYAMATDLPAQGARGRTVDALATLHMTTCTGLNGSRENGRTFCSKSVVNANGSDVTVELSVVAMDGDRACASIGTVSKRTRISRLRHHELLHLENRGFHVPDDVCGDRIRIAVTVRNAGPAALVMHEANSSLIAVVAE